MEKNEELYIKLNLEKNTDSGEIVLNIQFDNDAPNFTKEKDVISWNPSIEEWAFVNEIFEIISKGQGYKYGKKPILEENKAEEENKAGKENKAEEENFIPPTNENEIVDKFLEKNE